MTDVLQIVPEVLEDAKFQTWRMEFSGRPSLGFEDENILGVAASFETPQELIDGWIKFEDLLLARYGNNFRQAGEKAWNVYSVFLTSQAASDSQARAIRAIEEDLRQTRKLAAHSVVSNQSVRSALLPILPLGPRPELSAINASERLATRIENLSPGMASLVLDEKVSAAQLLARLGAKP